ncbi:MAG: hypothetical protein AB4042_14480 [Leptolyngbyaceae cyanobacterium]
MLRKSPEEMGFASNGNTPQGDDDSLDDTVDPNFLAVELRDAKGDTPDVFHTLDTLAVRVQFGLEPWPDKVEVVVQFLTPGDEISVSHFPTVLSLNPQDMVSPMAQSPPPPSHNNGTTSHTTNHTMAVDCTIPELLLRAGKYRVSVTVTPSGGDESQRSQSRLTSSTTIVVKDQLIRGDSSSEGPKKSPGLVYMPANWQLTPPPPAPSTPASTLESF